MSGKWECPFLRDLNEEDGNGNPRGTDDYLYYLYDLDNGGVHDNATIYAGALWEIREDLAAEDFDPTLADRIIYEALTNQAPLDSFFDGRLLVETAAEEIGDADSLPPSRQTELNDIVDAAFDEREINPDWDAGTGNDTRLLLEDTNPLGFAPSVPRVSGQRFVTVHYPDLRDFCCGPGQLFMGDVTGTPPPKPLTVSDGERADEQPDIGGGVIVWSRFSDGDRDLIATKKGSTTRLRTVVGGSAWQWFPSVDGNLVAWENLTSQTDIYARYGGRRIRKLTQTSGEEINPQVAGDTVAWWDLRSRVPRIGIRNLKTGTKATIKLTNPPRRAMIGPPAVTGKYVFWYQDRDGDGDGAIMRANHKGKRKKTVVPERSNFAPVWTNRVAEVPRPSANNSWVAYTTEKRFVVDVPSDQVGRDIFLVPAGGGRPKPVTCNRGDQAYPAVGIGQRTVWFDASRGQTDLVTWASLPGAPCG
jgi:hypothetical protein